MNMQILFLVMVIVMVIDVNSGLVISQSYYNQAIISVNTVNLCHFKVASNLLLLNLFLFFNQIKVHYLR